MRIPRICKICGKKFNAIQGKQLFCSRRCFRKDYFQKTKEKNREIKKRRPEYTCPLCGMKSIIDFDPIKNEKAFENLICPYCGVPHMTIVCHHENVNFFMGNSMTQQYVITSAIISGFY